MGNDKQMQKAGDNSQQFIVENISINNGITEQRAREIFAEMNAVARRDYTQDAYELAFKRVNMFEDLLMSKVEKVDGMLEAFADPSFQFLLTDAQKKAAVSERESDYELLTELLAHRVEKNDERKTKASIKKAIEIIDQIDDDALCGLTIVHIMCCICPTTGDINDGFEAVDNLFNSLLYTNLPKGMEWIEHLSILNAIRIVPYSGTQNIENVLENTFSGYMCVGIKKDSENYRKAIEILNRSNLPIEVLVNNELLDGYVKIPISNKLQINQMVICTGIETHNITDDEIKSLEEIFTLYSNDMSLRQQMKKSFMNRWNKNLSLRKISEWWNQIPQGFNITSIGSVLSRANAQRYDSTIPDLN